ncbi:LysM peptidoglycan-binding domain-containing protein [Streptantibioticus ferralitis]|uniref:LysM peptidoglycan-binding domain-containing protein n=1 Tax=Streptantibioticus ferralitis TaxID=236510 RepID=A0ABT5YU01_9ACTN|nr:LysM peptidoglycan-binding domain-containing protein [Streptantibioticus ferralitis]MDF2255079.1 LysM peptidoglycan-binding domain-containing protein [Streptantibioticus ferralitis]
MHIPAFTRLPRTRLGFAGGAVIAGTIAVSCVVTPGAAQAATADSAPATYTVVSGDNLSHIAQAEHVPGGWQAIAAINGIASPYIIQPGQQLSLPTGSAASTTAKAVPAVATATKTTAVKAAVAKTASATTSTQTYANNLDGWIKHALAIMQQKGIPGSYDGIHRNIMRESSGNPNAINLWDSNAAAGHPSIGLLQVIQPTFTAYHVAGTSTNIYDPVANITAACNYAYHRYGSIDNVNSAY